MLWIVSSKSTTSKCTWLVKADDYEAAIDKVKHSRSWYEGHDEIDEYCPGEFDPDGTLLVAYTPID